MIAAVVALVVRALAAIPVIAALVLLVATPADLLVMTGGTTFLLAYILGWQRIESGAVPLHRLLVPLLLAVGALTLAVPLALLATVDDPGLALVVALVGMAAAIGAVSLAVRPAPPR